MSGHAWEKNVLAPARLDLGKPEVCWFPRCWKCGCLVTACGKELVYRPTPSAEWTREQPPCGGP